MWKHWTVHLSFWNRDLALNLLVHKLYMQLPTGTSNGTSNRHTKFGPEFTSLSTSTPLHQHYSPLTPTPTPTLQGQEVFCLGPGLPFSLRSPNISNYQVAELWIIILWIIKSLVRLPQFLSSFCISLPFLPLS